jgi:hypothetical protein
MSDEPPADTPQDRLARIQELWIQLRDEHDPKQRRALEKRIRLESDAYKRADDDDEPER